MLNFLTVPLLGEEKFHMLHTEKSKVLGHFTTMTGGKITDIFQNTI